MFDPWTWTFYQWTLWSLAALSALITNPNGANHDPNGVSPTANPGGVSTMNNPNTGAAHMTEINTPAPTLEETETNLANLDPKTANILRRRMGLAIVETEPSREREEERERLAETRKQFEAMFPTPRVIDRTALELLDAEMAENARRRAEEEANKVVEFKERERRESEAVAAALEPLKARARRLSPVKRRREDAAVKIRGEPPDLKEIIYQHSVFCQTVLPYRNPGPNVRTWERQQGHVSLSLEAGRIRGPEGRYIPVGLPYGSYPRLILCYLNTEALRTRNRVINIDHSMTAYIRRLTGHQTRGADICRFKEQLTRTSACLIRMAYGIGPAAVQVDAKIITAFDLWEEDHAGKRFLFPQTIILGADYFEHLLAHAVPLDERAVAALSNSPMGLDTYSWSAQKAHRVDPQRGQFITWKALHAQFGQGYKEIRKFRRDFTTTLVQVQAHYPTLRIKLGKGGILIGHSPPPVPSRHAILLPPTKG